MEQHGGDAIKFLGDAVLILFPIQEVKSASALMASLCALQLARECASYDQGSGRSMVALRLHCAISCGSVHCMCLGDNDRWEYVITGEPLSQLGNAISHANTGHVVVTEKVIELLGDRL